MNDPQTPVNIAPKKRVIKVKTKAATTATAPEVIIPPLKPLIKWSGGKGDEIKEILPYLPSSYNTYLEPFIGGGALYFHLAPQKAVISDVHTELIDLYRSMSDGHADEIYEFMANTPNDEPTYYKVRDEMAVSTPLDNAKRFYYQRKTCFRGMLRYNKHGKFNIPFGRYKTVNFEDLKNPHYKYLLSRTTVLCSGFDTVFRDYNNEEKFERKKYLLKRRKNKKKRNFMTENASFPSQDVQNSRATRDSNIDSALTGTDLGTISS
jgi:site-specific DNA-adenine methylase